MTSIAAALEDVTERITAAGVRAGRDPDAVTLVTVTKTRTSEEIEQALRAGAADLGENYVQELVAKRQALAERGHDAIRWHAIGHLQRNKVKYLLPLCHLIHSVDSARLADEIQARAAQHDARQGVLLEVNVAGEASKFGVSPEEAGRLAQHVAGLEHVQLRGLMAMTPYGAGADESRRWFSALRGLAERLGRALPAGAMAELSMGMTQDYEQAVVEGATIVRVGTAIFGERRVA